MTTNKEFGQKLERRTKAFAVRIIRLVRGLPDDRTGDVIRYQLVKSGTSIGSNYREANRAVSRADFKYRISVCTKEASETQYWLEVVDEVGWIPGEQLRPVLKESGELLALFTSIGRSAQK